MPRRLDSWEARLDRDIDREPTLLTERQDPPRSASPLHEQCNTIWCLACRDWADECAHAEPPQPVQQWRIRLERTTPSGIRGEDAPLPMWARTSAEAIENYHTVFGKRRGWLTYAIPVAS